MTRETVFSDLEIINTAFVSSPGTGRVFWGPSDPRFYKGRGFYERHLRERLGREVAAFTISKYGHLAAKVTVLGKQRQFLLHRIVFVHAKGRLPIVDLDHVNGDPTDNRLANLREATRSENSRNAVRRMAGLKGAYSGAGGRWHSAIWDGKTLRHLGSFPTEAAAHEAWSAAAKAEHGEFFWPGHARVFG